MGVVILEQKCILFPGFGEASLESSFFYDVVEDVFAKKTFKKTPKN